MSHITIQFDGETKSEINRKLLIEHIAGMVGEGFTSGHYPHWNIEEV